MRSEEEKVFERIQIEAKINCQPIPSNFFVEGKFMYCIIPLQNPSVFAEKVDRKWIPFFE